MIPLELTRISRYKAQEFPYKQVCYRTFLNEPSRDTLRGMGSGKEGPRLFTSIPLSN